MEWSSRMVHLFHDVFRLPSNPTGIKLIAVHLENEPNTVYINLPAKPSCNFVRVVKDAESHIYIGWGYNPDKLKTKVRMCIYTTNYTMRSDEDIFLPPKYHHMFDGDIAVTYKCCNGNNIHGFDVEHIVNMRTDRMM